MKKIFLGILLICILVFILIYRGEFMSKAVPISEPQKITIDEKKYYEAIISTSKGEIKVSLDAQKAPWSVNNFVYLAKAGFYDGLTFHRVEPGFVIQGGDPKGDGTGGPGYTVVSEATNGLKHGKGALAWARLGDQVNPQRRSSGSQFYITLAPTPFLDNAYTVFGQTIAGQDIAEKISRGDMIKKITIIEK